MDKIKELERDLLKLFTKFEKETGSIPTKVTLDVANRKGHRSLLGCYISVIKNERA
jgi:hypothetical protein